MPILEVYRDLWSEFDETKEGTDKLVQAVLAQEFIWGLDLNTIDGLASKVSDYLYGILTRGVRSVMEEVSE